MCPTPTWQLPARPSKPGAPSEGLSQYIERKGGVEHDDKREEKKREDAAVFGHGGVSDRASCQSLRIIVSNGFALLTWVKFCSDKQPLRGRIDDRAVSARRGAGGERCRVDLAFAHDV